MATEPTRLLTYQDYLAFPDDGIRREIVGGEVYELNAPRTRHQRLVGRLFYELEGHVRREGGGEVFLSPVDVLVDLHDIVQPDIVFVSAKQASIVTEPNIDGVPALVVEVVSDPRHDRVRKRDLYARVGVTEYWIVDPDADRVEVYRRSGSTYGKPTLFEPGETLTTEPLPGLEIDVAGIFAR